MKSIFVLLVWTAFKSTSSLRLPLRPSPQLKVQTLDEATHFIINKFNLSHTDLDVNFTVGGEEKMSIQTEKMVEWAQSPEGYEWLSSLFRTDQQESQVQTSVNDVTESFTGAENTIMKSVPQTEGFPVVYGYKFHMAKNGITHNAAGNGKVFVPFGKLMTGQFFRESKACKYEEAGLVNSMFFPKGNIGFQENVVGHDHHNLAKEPNVMFGEKHFVYSRVEKEAGGTCMDLDNGAKEVPNKSKEGGDPIMSTVVRGIVRPYVEEKLIGLVTRMVWNRFVEVGAYNHNLATASISPHVIAQIVEYVNQSPRLYNSKEAAQMRQNLDGVTSQGDETTLTSDKNCYHLWGTDYVEGNTGVNFDVGQKFISVHGRTNNGNREMSTAAGYSVFEVVGEYLYIWSPAATTSQFSDIARMKMGSQHGKPSSIFYGPVDGVLGTPVLEGPLMIPMMLPNKKTHATWMLASLLSAGLPDASFYKTQQCSDEMYQQLRTKVIKSKSKDLYELTLMGNCLVDWIAPEGKEALQTGWEFHSAVAYMHGLLEVGPDILFPKDRSASWASNAFGKPDVTKLR